MLLKIEEKSKKEIFVSLFQLLKNFTNIVNVMFNEEDIYIQGMDRSHVCLFDIKIGKSWFGEYNKNKTDIGNISIDTNLFHSVLAMSSEHHTIQIEYNGEPDTLQMEFNSNKAGHYDKHFNIPLTDLDAEIFSIPPADYDAEFTIDSKKISEITSQLLTFGEILNIKCTEDTIVLGTSGVYGEMNVNIPIEDLSEYAISEGGEINVLYGLNYIHKLCLTTKLSSEIGFSISNNLPLKINYDLGEGNHIFLYVAPKIDD